MVNLILKRYGLNENEYSVQQFHSGLINKTWKISSPGKNYILQKINDQVFKDPGAIDQNLHKLNSYLQSKYPGYLFVAPIASGDGTTLIKNTEGYFRLLPFIEGSHTIETVSTSAEAYEAARQFGKFSRVLSGFDAAELADTLPDFHNLSLRYSQFLTACSNASPDKFEKAKTEISLIEENVQIVSRYTKIRAENLIPLRVIHHDTKISNVLFQSENKGLCVIDLDTVMPGYFFSDVGDMMRTYLSPANEEETDFSRIIIRKDFFKAICQGYLSEMGSQLTAPEKQLFIYSGEFIIYMQAIRFLTDYLSDDVYYGARYPGHNLNRAINQLTLLKQYLGLEEDFDRIMEEADFELGL